MNEYIHDHPEKEVFPLDCVPPNRSKGSWTQGVKAWEKVMTLLQTNVLDGFTHPGFVIRVTRTATTAIFNTVDYQHPSKKKNRL